MSGLDRNNDGLPESTNPSFEPVNTGESSPTSSEPPPPDLHRGVPRWARICGYILLVLFVLLVGACIAGYQWASSDGFENTVRKHLIVELQSLTGGRVEIATLHWDLLHLHAEATNITIHGLEASNEAPYAHIDRLQVSIAILGLFQWGPSPRVILRDAQIDRPKFHFIVYADGTTNQPHPKRKRKQSTSAIDNLFNAEIGQLQINNGLAQIADFEVPLNFAARNTSLQLNWVPDTGATMAPTNNAKSEAVPPGSYRINLSVADLAFAQAKENPPPSRLDASLVLFHDSVRLDSLRLTALDRVLNLRGILTNFARPSWQAQAQGQIDLRILAPYTTFAYARTGAVTLHATGSGRGSQFTASGDLASDAIHYQDTVVDAQTAAFSARFHADQKQLNVTDIQTHLQRGGEVDGELLLDNWLDSTPAPAVQASLRREHKTWPVPTGLVRANLKGITLDTILVMLASPEYQKLGLNTVVSGPATARWTSRADDLEIGGQLALTPSSTPIANEVPVQGSVDGTYRYATGSVEIKSLDAHLRQSAVQAQGSLGVYPITRASQLHVDFNSANLSEFDAILRTLGLHHGARQGAEALPVQLHGQAQFHGTFSSAWLTPHIDGRLTANNMGIEIPSTSNNAEPYFFPLDSLDAEGSYAPASIVIRHGTLHRGAASITLQGHLDSEDPDYQIGFSEPEFDAHAILSLKAQLQQAPIEDLLPLVNIHAPVKGIISSRVDVDGQLNNLIGAGSVDLDQASLYGESVQHVHAVGAINGQTLKLTSVTAQQSSGSTGGKLTATATYNWDRHSFQLDAHGSGIDLAAIHALRDNGLSVGGKLAFNVDGAGTQSDPRIQAHATFGSLVIAGEQVADLQLTASTRNRTVSYDLSSHQPTGDFSAQGETGFDPDLKTQATVRFTHFDIGAMLKLLHVTGISGESDLEGVATISGPLRRPESIRGEAKLDQLAFSLEGVHLASKGSVHATLIEGIARLDPVEITGEDTDLRLHGSLAFTGKRQLDLGADGAVNMRLAETLDPDLTARGATTFQMEAHGPVSNPTLQGKVEFKNASLALHDFPNGLSQINGTLDFIQNRLQVRSLTAMSGGGQLSVGGYIGFQRGLYADLTVTGKSIRIRYPQGISSIADATLKLQGPQNNLLLSGNVLVTRFAVNSDFDLSVYASQPVSVQPIVSPDAPSNHLRLDVHVISAPQLNFQNAYAKLAGDVDLRLRGTLAAPSLLGRISLTEGTATVSGTRYELQRGEINFNNPVRIQPEIDIDATARVEDYDITLGLHGTASKPRFTYRSEPPLAEADILTLLALGRTQNEQTAYVQQQQQAGDNPMTDALLGGALNATVSNRVQRLFGTGAVKIDPNFIGSLGNSTARVTVVEQIGNNLTFTYASNVNTTTQQLIQAEIAINRHVSLLLTQDESGIFSAVIEARRSYR
ncbi:translocation/assembly module TamB [Acidicapsa dinghuensis]|uniref:Translocation/assembly module TamB n=1 Tax=Acidicapsa dinghuensis TaxID=2218256 RepID=A0ABW1EIJ4_9BACT|nr:translocation/assembly module TamB [Acidicapsa dinghuensis]